MLAVKDIENKHLNIKLSNNCLTFSNKASGFYDTSIANALRRSMYNLSYCYAPSYEITAEQKDAYRKYFNVVYEHSETYFTVNHCNYISGQFLSHRLMRLPFYLCRENEYLYKQGVYVCLHGAEMNVPFINTSNELVIIKTSDLYFYTINTSDELVPLTAEQKKSIIKYDCPYVILEKENTLHFVARLEKGYGIMEETYPNASRFEPVSIIYNFGEESTPDYTKIDRFDNPKQIVIKTQFTGKKDLIMAYNDAIDFIILQLNIFKKEYNKALLSQSDIIKIENINSNIQYINVINDQIYFLADHTLGNLISSHLLKLVLDEIEDNITDEELLMRMLSQILCSYIEPDESALIRKIVITYQLPEESICPEFYKLYGDTNMINVKAKILMKCCDILIKYFNELIIPRD